MRKTIVIVLTCLISSTLVACGGGSTTEPPPDGGRVAGDPPGWDGSGSGYQIGVDNSESHGGETSAYMSASSRNGNAFGNLMQTVRADAYRGKRMRWSGWVKHTDLTGPDVGLWMRVDGPGEVASCDNMSNRSLSGSAGWHQVSIVLDVPENAIGIALGALLVGTGTLQIDDLEFEEVGSDVPVTNLYATPGAGPDSATAVETYSSRPDAPANLDFEGLTSTSQAPAAWLPESHTPLAPAAPAQN
jgi:hypothetical protein